MKKSGVTLTPVPLWKLGSHLGAQHVLGDMNVGFSSLFSVYSDVHTETSSVKYLSI